MRLADWGFLFIALLIPLLHRWWRRRNRPAAVTFPVAIPPEHRRASPTRVLLGLRYLGLLLLLFCLARPQLGSRSQERTVSGVDITMVLDVSASMKIEDLSEKSRIDIAKETMERFIRGRTNDRIGFVIFSGEPLTLAPPTLDYSLVLKSLRDVTLGVLRDGTAIGDGLAMAVNHLRNSTAKTRVIILLTDGDNNVGQVDPGTAGELAHGYGIRVYTIAIGREGRVRLPIDQQGAFGTIRTYQWFDNALNPELLEQIAKLTQGKFYRVTDESALDQVFKEIDQLERTDVKSKERIQYDEVFQKFLKLAIFLLVLEQLLGRLWWRFVP
jgi:Ca-activated chloride channel family protein